MWRQTFINDLKGNKGAIQGFGISVYRFDSSIYAILFLQWLVLSAIHWKFSVYLAYLSWLNGILAKWWTLLHLIKFDGLIKFDSLSPDKNRETSDPNKFLSSASFIHHVHNIFLLISSKLQNDTLHVRGYSTWHVLPSIQIVVEHIWY